MKTSLILRSSRIFLGVALLWASQGALAQKATVKINKNYVNISPPNEQGMVAIQGEAGAVESTSPATLQAPNEETDVGAAGTIREDGSFEAKIAASSGDKIRLTARNEEGKTSRATFKVPLGYASETPAGEGPIFGGPREVIVSIRIMDKRTGRLLDSENVEGVLPSRRDPNQPGPRQKIQSLLDKCIAAAKAEFSGNGQTKTDNATSADNPKPTRRRSNVIVTPAQDKKTGQEATQTKQQDAAKPAETEKTNKAEDPNHS